MSQKVCRRCLISEMGEAQYKEMIEKSVSVIKKEDLATAKVLDSRLAICKQCDKLNAGTCGACGCYVEIRAAMARSKCPDKLW